MAIAFDAASSVISATGVATATLTHTVSAGLANGVLTVWPGYYMRTASVTSVTYGGVALTLDLRYENGSANATQELWQLVAPASGTASIVIRTSVTLTNIQMYAQALSFSGVDQAAPIETGHATTVITGAHSTHTDALTPVNDGAWVVDSILHGATLVATPGGTQTARATSFSTVNSVGKSLSSVGPVSPPASTSMAWTFASSSTASNHLVAALKPASAAAGAPAFLPEALGLHPLGVY